MPKRMSTPDPGQPVAMAPATSPSVISRMRAPDCPHLGDEVGVAGPVEDDRGQVADRLAERLGQGLEVLGGRLVDVDRAPAPGPDGDLLHVDAGPGVEHGAPLGDGDDRQRPAAAEGGGRGAVDGVDGDVGLGRRAVADPLAVVEHGGVVLLALADDHDAVHATPSGARPAWR